MRPARRSLASRLAAVVAVSLLVALPSAAAHTADGAGAASIDLFPKSEEVQQSLATLAEHPWVTLHEVGRSKEGRPIVLAEVTDPESPVPVNERVVTFIFTQQHGNEPAGTPAALELLENITAGDAIADTLGNQVLLLLPQVNPDGAEAESRGNADGVDTNRDHIHLATLEARAVHDVMNRWDVHMVVDHHEYGGLGAGNPSPVRAYDYDLTTLHPTHGNVREPARGMAQRLQEEAMWPAAAEAGFHANWYGEVTAAGIPVDQIAGGPDPGIARNHGGLHHAASVLVESRIDQHPNPFHDMERRVAIHRVVMEATLAFGHENAVDLIAAKRASEALALEDPATQYLQGERTGPLADWYRVDAADVEDLAHALVRHGLPPGIPGADGTSLHDMRHVHRAHAAALMHPASTRNITAAAPADAPADPVALAAGDASTPAPAIVAVLAAVAGVALARRGRA